jgi:MFS family permease
VQLLYKLAHPAAARNEVSRLRVAVTTFFALDGFVFASWAVRIPAVKAAVGASPAALGLALLGVSGGAIATMAISGGLCRRFGSPRVAVAGAVWLSLALLLPALAHTAVALAAGLAVFGIGYGCLNVSMNSLAVDLVAALRRPVMPSFHAAWSLGGLGGAALGGLLAPDLAPIDHFFLVCVLALGVTGVCGRVVLEIVIPAGYGAAGTSEATGPGGRGGVAGTGADPSVVAAEPRQQVWRVVLILGVICLCATYGEGAVSDWGALHLRTDLHADAGLAAAGYAAFALAEAAGRLAGSWLLARLGQARVLILGGLITAAGILGAALAPTLPLALLGFALAGLGIANAFPAAMIRAGQLAGPSGVAATSMLGYAGFLLGPPIIGFLASRLSLSISLTTVSALALVAVVLAWISAERPPRAA